MVPDGPTVILLLKIVVSAATALFLASLIPLAWGNYRLHGRVNLVFFVLTVSTVLVFETLLQLGLDVRSFMTETERQTLQIHLCFAGPLPLVMGLMLYTGLRHLRRLHLILAALFVVLWAGTVTTGVFFLPHRQ
ncbi:MAG: hypothetical protein C4296_13135 [Gemmataceae bacterium]